MSFVSETAARSLLHFVWQGAVLGLLSALVLRAMRGASARARYAVACGFLLLMLASPFVTYGVLASSGPVLRSGVAAPSASVALPDTGAAPMPRSWLPVVFNVWLAGVSLFAIRAAGGWALAVRRLRAGRVLAGPAVQTVCTRVASMLGVSRVVRV